MREREGGKENRRKGKGRRERQEREERLTANCQLAADHLHE